MRGTNAAQGKAPMVFITASVKASLRCQCNQELYYYWIIIIADDGLTPDENNYLEAAAAAATSSG